jgi:hypothetical protein
MSQLSTIDTGALLEKVVIGGDLAKLSPQERLGYYKRVCDSVGLNPLTKPFDYLQLGGRLVLYANKAAAEQLRKVHRVSIDSVSGQMVGDCYVATAVASSNGRSDVSTGAVPLAGLKGEGYSNAIMKAETKAKRRVTLSICGLGMLDESEVETIPNAQPVQRPVPAAVGRLQAVIDEKRADASVDLDAIRGEVKALLAKALDIDDPIVKDYKDVLRDMGIEPPHRIDQIARGQWVLMRDHLVVRNSGGGQPASDDVSHTFGDIPPVSELPI